MWNWKEFYQIAEQVGKYVRILSSGESFVQIPQGESMGASFLLHTISGIYRGYGAESSFSGYETGRVMAGRMAWLYLKKIPGTGEVLFNAVFLRHGRKRQKVQVQEHHGINMIYRRMGTEQMMEGEGWENFSVDVKFRKLVVIGQGDTEIRKATIAELLDIFARATDEEGMMLLFEQNARMLYQVTEERKQSGNLEIGRVAEL